MNRQRKEQMIDFLRNGFNQNSAAFLVEVQSLNVEKTLTLRRKLHDLGASMKVAKNTLLRLSSSELPVASEMDNHFSGQVAIIFVGEIGNVPSVAKVLSDTAKENKSFGIKMGYFESAVLSKDTVIELASLPSREVLLARLAGAIQNPLVRTARAVKEVSARIARGVQSVADQKNN